MGGMGYGVKKVKGLEFGVLQNTVASADCITGGVQLAEDWERREARGEGCCGRERLPTVVCRRRHEEWFWRPTNQNADNQE